MMIHNNRARGSWIGAARLGPAAVDQAIEDETIRLGHDARRAHGAARVARHDQVGLREMLAGAVHKARTDLSKRRARQRRAGSLVAMPASRKASAGR